MNVESGNLLQRLKGKGKEEKEGRERTDKNQKNVTGARTLAGNCSGGPTPPFQCGSPTHFQPSDSIQSLLRSSFNTVSAARDSNSWVVLLTCPPADGQSVCNDKFQQEVCSDWWKHWCYTPDTMDIPGSQCNVEPNRPMTPSLLYQLLLYHLLLIWSFLWYL